MTRQIERLRPQQIRDALAERSLVYLPLGTIEWHCEHLPVGLDAATAHALCLAAAEREGGLVYPPLYWGTGGDHSEYPWTVMLPDPATIEVILIYTLSRLASFGVSRCVLFSGHFANEQIDLIDRIAETWNASGRAPRVTALAVNQCPVPGLAPDHAGAFETTLMTAIDPSAVDLLSLPDLALFPDNLDRHDPTSPIWGIIGADPRQADLSDPMGLFERMVTWLSELSR